MQSEASYYLLYAPNAPFVRVMQFTMCSCSNFLAGTEVQQANLGPPAHIAAAGLEWVSSNTGGSFVPADSFVGGYRPDNAPVYVIRALAPDGKYHPGKSGSGVNCRYAYDDQEQTTTIRVTSWLCLTVM